MSEAMTRNDICNYYYKWVCSDPLWGITFSPKKHVLYNLIGNALGLEKFDCDLTKSMRTNMPLYGISFHYIRPQFWVQPIGFSYHTTLIKDPFDKDGIIYISIAYI